MSSSSSLSSSSSESSSDPCSCAALARFFFRILRRASVTHAGAGCIFSYLSITSASCTVYGGGTTHCRLNLPSYSIPPTTFSSGSCLSFLNRATSLSETVNSSSAGSCQAAFLRFVVLIAFAGRSEPDPSESDEELKGKAETKAGGGDWEPEAVGASTKKSWFVSSRQFRSKGCKMTRE